MSPHLSRFPRRKLAIVTCMDCRINPLVTAGLEVGEAHIIRNAGGVVTADVRRSLALSQRALATKEVWIVMHTACGVLGLDDAEFLDQIESASSHSRWVCARGSIGCAPIRSSPLRLSAGSSSISRPTS
jgi:carbonic anhydrase